MAKPKIEKKKHIAAFEYYYSLGIVDSKKRSLVGVASRFGISESAAFGWSVAFNWQKRIVERENLVAGLVAEKSIEDEVAMRKRHLTLCKAVQGRFAELLKNKTVKPTASDFEKIAKLEILLTGGATERSEVNVTAGIAGHLMSAVLGVIETTLPDRCPGCSIELDLKNSIAVKLIEASDKIGATTDG